MATYLVVEDGRVLANIDAKSLREVAATLSPGTFEVYTLSGSRTVVIEEVTSRKVSIGEPNVGEEE